MHISASYSTFGENRNLSLSVTQVELEIIEGDTSDTERTDTTYSHLFVGTQWLILKETDGIVIYGDSEMKGKVRI